MPEWNTEFVTDMSALFQNAHAFDQDIGNWNTSRVTNMRIMFGAAAKFDGDLSNWDVSSVTDMENMFLNARAFSGGDLSSWNTGKVTKMNGMFADNAHNGASRFNGDLSNWDVSSVTDMSAMFLRAVKFQGKGLSRWDVRGVTSTSNMFNGASVFRGDIMAWDLGSGTSADGMFNGATAWQSVYVDCSAVNCGSDNHDRLRPLRRGVLRREVSYPQHGIFGSGRAACGSGRQSTTICTFPARLIRGARRFLPTASASPWPLTAHMDPSLACTNSATALGPIGSDIAPFSSLHMSAAGNRVVVGPQNCELVCEGHGYGSSGCVALVGCQYDHTSSECHSAVGPHPCDSQSGHPHSNAHVTVYGYHAQDNAWLPVGGEDFSGDVNSTMGHDVALSMDGSRVAMSAVEEDDVAGNHTEAGLVRVYEWRRGEWIQLGQDLRGVDHDERFGATVSLSNDGARLVVASGAGFATAYRLDLGSGRWRQMGDAFPGNSATRACISGDGGTVAVGVTDIDSRPRVRRGVPVERERRSLDAGWGTRQKG
jgi:surface protein